MNAKNAERSDAELFAEFLTRVQQEAAEQFRLDVMPHPQRANTIQWGRLDQPYLPMSLKPKPS